MSENDKQRQCRLMNVWDDLEDAKAFMAGAAVAEMRDDAKLWKKILIML